MTLDRDDGVEPREDAPREASPLPPAALPKQSATRRRRRPRPEVRPSSEERGCAIRRPGSEGVAAGGGAPPEETGRNDPEDRTSFSTTLRRIALTDSKKISVGDAIRAFGDGGLAATLTLLGLVNMLPLPPGSSTVLGLPLLLVSWQLARGRTAIRLPARISAGSVGARHFRTILKRLGGSLAAVERCMKPRLTFLVVGTAQRVIGVICVGLASVLMLPIWGGNLVPAAIVTLFGMGLMRRDGLVVLVAWAAVIALGVAVWMLFDLIRQQGAALWERLAMIVGGA